MALGREVDYRILALDRMSNSFFVSNIAMDERVAWRILY
jgi:hypothetical protein